MSFIKTADGTSLYYKDWGTGRPVVFIHGWPVNADMWEYQMPALASQGLRCIAYDRRGFGRSDQPYGGYDYDTFAGDLASVLDSLDLQDVLLVGFSMGGGEVARYLAHHNAGGRVTGAVLLAAVTPFLLKTADNPNGADGSVFEGMIEGLKADRPAFLGNFGKAFYNVGLLSFDLSNALLDWSQMLALQASPVATIGCVRAFASTDFRADLPKITVPTLIIHGDADQIVPIAISGRVAVTMIPQAQLIEYAGAPHGLFYTERDRLNMDLLAFAKRA